VDFEITKMDSVDKDRFSSLEQQVKLLSSKNQVSGTITVSTDFIAGIQTIEDVEGWLLRYYYADVGGDPPDEGNGDTETDWNFTTSTQKKADTSFMSFGPFSDRFVVLVIAEDLECQSTKGETLKEMEAFLIRLVSIILERSPSPMLFVNWLCRSSQNRSAYQGVLKLTSRLWRLLRIGIVWRLEVISFPD
jgi:hypothetical protein